MYVRTPKFQIEKKEEKKKKKKKKKKRKKRKKEKMKGLQKILIKDSDRG
jgi:hypothetical protein